MKRLAWLAHGPISDYVTELVVPLLSNRYSLEHFQHPEACKRAHLENRFDLFIYQIEDEPCSLAFERMACEMPGLLYLHDFILRPRHEGEGVRYLEEAYCSAHHCLFSGERALMEAQKLLGASTQVAQRLPVPARISVSNRKAHALAFIGALGPEHRVEYLLRALSEVGQPLALCWVP